MVESTQPQDLKQTHEKLADEAGESIEVIQNKFIKNTMSCFIN